MCRLLCIAALLLSACGGSGGAPLLQAGAGSALLRIPVGHSHAGYLQSDALGAPWPPDDPGSPFAEIFPATRSLQSAPRAKAVVLESGSRRVVLAQIDAIFVTAALTERVQALAKSRLGVDLDGKLLLHASHTHASAGRFSASSIRPTLLAAEPAEQRGALAHGIDTFSAESTDRIAGAVVEAVGQALAHLRPARFGWGRGTSETASRDRRCHDDWITGKGDRDQQLTVLRVDEAEGGAPIAILFHFAMHGTLYDHDSRSLSVDAPGHVEYAVERRFDRPVVAIFLQGAAASASPNGDAAGHSGSQAMERIGWDLSRTILEIYEGIETEPSLDLRLGIHAVPIDARRLGYEAGEFPSDGAMLCHFLDSSCNGAARDPAALDCLGRAEKGGGKYETWLAALRLGDLALLTLPGEPSAAVGRALAEGARARGYVHAIPLGYTLDHDGYILFADDWLSGGSETNITFWGWRYADYAVEESLRALDFLGAAALSQAVRAAAKPQWEYEAALPSASSSAPAVVGEPPEVVERMTELAFAFHGGDPALGTPEIVLQRAEDGTFADALQRAEDGTFADVLQRAESGVFADVLRAGWIPVSNLRGPELPTFYDATPTWREAKDAKERAHLWRVLYEPPRDLAAGSYRLVARGQALVGAAVAAYELASRRFEVVPSSAMRIEAAIVDGYIEATLLYPVRKPVYAAAPRNDGWQIGGFRAVDPRFRAEFVPVLDGEAVTSGEGAAAFTFVARELAADVLEYAPGHGPGFRAGAAAAHIPAGALRDRWGNRNGAEVEVDRAPSGAL